MKKKFIVYFCIWIVVTIPTLSYAWLPLANAAATVITATKVGQVLISKGGRVVKYAVPAEKLKNAAIAVYGFCMQYSAFTGDTCGEFGKRVYDILTKDGWQTEQNGNGIEIYKSQVCDYEYSSISTGRSKYKSEDALVKGFYRSNHRFDSDNSTFRFNYYEGMPTVENKRVDAFVEFTRSDGEKNGFRVYIDCILNEKNKQYLTSDDIWNMIQDPSNGFNDQDITNILKYDYSDKSVTINNHTYNGGDIKPSFDPNVNINRDGDGTDGKPGWGLEIAPEFAPRIVPIIVNPNIKIGLPDINYNNCTANASGAIVNCDKLERKYNIDIDGDGKIGNEDPTCPDGYTLKDDKCVKVDPKPPSDEPKDPKDPKDPQPLVEQKPWLCTTSEFTRKVCDWIDWTQKDYGSDNDTKIQVTDLTKQLPQIDTNRIKFNGQCPSAETQNIRLMGASVNIKIKYDHYCEFMIKFKPFAIGLASISAVLIITRRA